MQNEVVNIDYEDDVDEQIQYSMQNIIMQKQLSKEKENDIIFEKPE